MCRVNCGVRSAAERKPTVISTHFTDLLHLAAAPLRERLTKRIGGMKLGACLQAFGAR